MKAEEHNQIRKEIQQKSIEQKDRKEMKKKTQGVGQKKVEKIKLRVG